MRGRGAPAKVAPEKDPAYAGRRDNDTRSFHAWSFVENLAWPVAAIAIAFLAAITAVFILHGQARVESFVNFLQGPAVLGLIGAVLAAAVKVVASVPHTARLERRQAEVQEGVAEATSAATASAERVDTIAHFTERLDGKVDRLTERVDKLAVAGPKSPELDTITGVVRSLAEVVKRIDARSQATQDVVVGYGSQLEAVAQLSTGELRAQTAAVVRDVAAAETRQRVVEAPWEPPWGASGPEAHPGDVGRPAARPEARYEPRREPRPSKQPDPPRPADAPHPFDTRYPHHRDATAEQPAVPTTAPADETEDWQPDGQDEGPGLDTSLIRGFRAQQARLDAEDEARRRARAQPAATPEWEPAPIRAAREKAEELRRQHDAREQMRRRQSQWDNPEEGPR